MAIKDMVGQVYGKLTVVSFVECRGSGRHAYWMTSCECGNSHIVRGSHLRSMEVVECSICQSNTAREKSTTHGLTYDAAGNKCKIFQAYLNIKKRCYNPNNKAYTDYGAKGITMQQSWLDDPTSFVNYLGEAPSSEHSVERLDVDRGYEEGNIVWALPTTQGRNRRGGRDLPTCVYKKRDYFIFNKYVLGKSVTIAFRDEDKELALFAAIEYRDLLFKRLNQYVLPEGEKYSEKHGIPHEYNSREDN